MSEELLKYKPYKSNFELSSKGILTKNPNLRFKFFSWGDGGGGEWGWSQEEAGVYKCKITNKNHNKNSST